MYILVHLYGGLLESVTPYQSLALAEKGLEEAIPEPCECGDVGACQSYQEAYLVDAPLGLNRPEATIDSRHTPSK